MYEALRPRFYFLAAILFISNSSCHIFVQSKESTSDVAEEYSYEYIEQKEYGYSTTDYSFESLTIAPNAFMANILMSYGVAYDKILELEKAAENIFSMRKIHAGKDIIFIKKDECEGPICFAYNPDPYSYVLFDFENDIKVQRIQKPFEICQKTISGAIFNTLSADLITRGGTLDLVDKMEDALAQVYFGAAQPGDMYKLVYEEIVIDGKPVGAGNILAAQYTYAANPEKSAFGYYYENEKYQGYYDETGNANKRSFLRSPIRERYRISSFYNMNRFHPVLKRRRPHLGTDFAAATGTPIMAVADGVLTQRSFTKGNGNYVKIRHDKVYESQYLHMSRFASGVTLGSRVKQGQTIGYVGQTGLATGPHVCFRFWKNGKQINHMRENFAPLDPMPKSELPQFMELKSILDQYLIDIPYVNYKQELAEKEAALAQEKLLEEV
jgi:murein DD-endopeptidase MepM/ murein hydrolase activator NlpD